VSPLEQGANGDPVWHEPPLSDFRFRYIVTMTNGMFGSGKYVESVVVNHPDPFAAVQRAIARWRRRDAADESQQTHTWQSDNVSIHVERVR